MLCVYVCVCVCVCVCACMHEKDVYTSHNTVCVYQP